jgi:hypothetical protein
MKYQQLDFDQSKLVAHMQLAAATVKPFSDDCKQKLLAFLTTLARECGPVKAQQCMNEGISNAFGEGFFIYLREED